MEVKPVKQLAERPPCQLKTSSQCNGKALMRIALRSGRPVNVCHYCRWLSVYGEEWNPMGYTSYKNKGRMI
jgi:hypothetical protein